MRIKQTIVTGVATAAVFDVITMATVVMVSVDRITSAAQVHIVTCWHYQPLATGFAKSSLTVTGLYALKLGEANRYIVKLSRYLSLRWHHGAVGRVSDLRARGRGFESGSGTRRRNPGRVSHTCVPLFTKQYKLVPAKGR